MFLQLQDGDDDVSLCILVRTEASAISYSLTLQLLHEQLATLQSGCSLTPFVGQKDSLCCAPCCELGFIPGALTLPPQPGAL